MFPLERSIKGRTAEAIATIIFERGGYRLARFGIEELFREVKLLNEEEYQQLNLDLRLRALPDFLISTPKLDVAYQVEVKFRRNLYVPAREELATKIDALRENWPNTYVLLLVGYSPNRFNNAKFFQDFVRVIPPSFPTAEMRVKRKHDDFRYMLPEVPDIFPLIRKSDFDLDSIIPFLKELHKLGAPEPTKTDRSELAAALAKGPEVKTIKKGRGVQITVKAVAGSQEIDIDL